MLASGNEARRGGRVQAAGSAAGAAASLALGVAAFPALVIFIGALLHRHKR